ncbi:MAG: hypothetical protein RBR32_10300 [Bacteroidales bacterium]|nr:hypothetical protein [Bacteroidales bacterium]
MKKRIITTYGFHELSDSVKAKVLEMKVEETMQIAKFAKNIGINLFDYGPQKRKPSIKKGRTKAQ